MKPECISGLGKSHGNFRACHTQIIIIVTVIVIIIDSTALIIIDLLDEKLLQTEAPILPSSLPALSLLHYKPPGHNSTETFPRQLSALSPNPSMSLGGWCDCIDPGVKTKEEATKFKLGFA